MVSEDHTLGFQKLQEALELFMEENLNLVLSEM